MTLCCFSIFLAAVSPVLAVCYRQKPLLASQVSLLFVHAYLCLCIYIYTKYAHFIDADLASDYAYIYIVSYLCVTLFCQIRMCLGLYRVINQSCQSQNKGFYQIYCVFIITISHWHIIAWIWLPCYYPSDNQLNKDLLNLTCLWCLENGIICYFMKPSETVTNLYIMKKNRLKSYLQPSYQVTIDW